MTTSPLIRFWNLINQYKKPIKLIYYYAIISGMVNLSLPLGIQAIINYLQTGELTTSWVVLVIFVLIGIAISGKIQISQLRVVEDIQQDIFAKSAFEFAFRIPKIKQISLDKYHAPELVNRFFDVLTIQKGLPKILIDFSLASFQIIFGLILLTFYSPFFIILGLSLVLIIYLIFKTTGPKGLDTSIKESKYKYSLTHWIEEIASNSKSFKTTDSKNLHLKKTDDITYNYLKNRESHFKVLINQFAMFIGFKVFVAAGLLILGGYLVFKQQMNIGQFVASEIIIILIINSVEKIIRIVETIYDVLTALDKIGYVTDLPLDKDDGYGTLRTENGVSVELKNIYFKYPEQDDYLFDKVSLKINAYDKVLLKGKSGKGKSTLLNLLSRVNQVDQGEILINNRPIHFYGKESFNKQIALLNPNTKIFEGTIRENILMNREVEREELMELLEKLKLIKYTSKLKTGLKTIIDSEGRRLPRNVIQKILLARTLIGKPKLLLMEDPLQFIDEKEKKEIIDFMMLPNQPWTAVIITDNQYWVEKVNQIIKL